MRLAKAEDHWRHVYDRPYQSSVSSLSFQRIVGLGDGEILFRGGITAICGGNGVGKSTLLDAILHSLDPTKPVIPTISSKRFSNAQLMVRLNSGGQAIERLSIFSNGKASITGGENNLLVNFIDPASLATKLIERFANTQNLEELLETYDPNIADPLELGTLSYLIKKDYESCETYEIEDDEPSTPYFKVVAGGITYGSETMGVGELSLHLIYWHINHLPDNSILLLEEPETYISPQSQSALMNVIAKISSEKGIWVILTTHSPGIVAHVPPDHIRLLYREAGIVTVLNNPNVIQLQTVLGIPPTYSGLFLVEDRAAHEFLKALLLRLAPDLAQFFEIVDGGSVGGMIATLNNFPNSGPWLRIIGIFDGDMRDKIGELKRPYSFLPGEMAPEIVLREYIQGNAQLLANKMSLNLYDIKLVLATLEGADPHDWLEGLSKSLGTRFHLMVDYLVMAWLDNDVNINKAHELITSIRIILEQE